MALACPLLTFGIALGQRSATLGWDCGLGLGWIHSHITNVLLPNLASHVMLRIPFSRRYAATTLGPPGNISWLLRLSCYRRKGKTMNHTQFLEGVQRHAALGSSEEADRIIQAALQALAEHLSKDAAEDLAAQLP